MSAATSPGTWSGLRPAAGRAAWGMARPRAMKHAEQPPAKRRGPKPAISDHLVASKQEASRRARATARLGLRVCRASGLPASGCSALLLSPHRCRRRGGNPHDGEISLMPRTSDGVRVFTRRLGLDLHRRRALRRGWHCARRPLRRPAADQGLAGLYGSSGRRGSWPCGHGSQYLSLAVLGQAVLGRPQTNGVAEPIAGRNDHGACSGAAGRRPRLLELQSGSSG